MSKKRITELPSISSSSALNNNDLFTLIDVSEGDLSSKNKKVSLGILKENIQSNEVIAQIGTSSSAEERTIRIDNTLGSEKICVYINGSWKCANLV